MRTPSSPYRFRRNAPFTVPLLAALTLATIPLPAQVTAPMPDSLVGLFQQNGIRVLQPASPASDFKLPDLMGGELALSDFYGSWVVLTFFATWCGPCRHELPTLERLHRQRAEDGVVVLGVSVDDDQGVLGPFVSQLKLSFPIVWDRDKQVGAAYRATSIPISYLVDPEGRLVAVSRGSRDWAALSPMFDSALAAVPATLTLEPNPDAYADSGEAVATPQVSDPPTAELALSSEMPQAGEPFHLDIRLRWAGNFNEYLPHPPKILLPEGVEQEEMTAESTSREGSNLITYRVTLRAAEAGQYALDPVELSYTPRFDQQPVASRILGPTVDVRPPTILGLAPKIAAIAGGGVVILGLVVAFLARRLRRAKRAGSPADAELYERLKAEHEEARKLRMQGDGAGFLVALAELDQALREARDEEIDEAEDAALREAVERARFGGQVPPAEELEPLQRRVERRLEELRGDLGRAERDSVKLKDGQSV